MAFDPSQASAAGLGQAGERSETTPMKAVSLFSGAGGFEIGLERAGIQTVLQAENDPWCLEVLARHWPEVQRIDDVRLVRLGEPAGRSPSAGLRPTTDLRGREAGAGLPSGIDLVYGGFPCQDLSVAGNRAGFRGQRSSLWFEFQRVLSELRPRWTVIENVPGLLSSDGGRDMATVLGGLGDLGYGWAYRVLDARWFGVPQRRRRVFIVGCFGDAARAAAVLAVCESCGGHPAPRREAGQDASHTLRGGTSGARGLNSPQAWNTDLIADPVTSSYAKQADSSDRAAGPVNLLVDDIAPTLDDGARRASVELPMIAASLSAGGHPGSNMPGRHHEDDENLIVAEARALTARASGYRMDFETENFLVASPVRASDGHHGYSSGRGDGADNLIATFQQSSLAGKGTFGWRDHATESKPVKTQVDGQMIVTNGVRRLTPRECERLQGWGDDHTCYTADGKPIPDSHRYRMIGNGVASPCAEWLGHRLVEADRWP